MNLTLSIVPVLDKRAVDDASAGVNELQSRSDAVLAESNLNLNTIKGEAARVKGEMKKAQDDINEFDTDVRIRVREMDDVEKKLAAVKQEIMDLEPTLALDDTIRDLLDELENDRDAAAETIDILMVEAARRKSDILVPLEEKLRALEERAAALKTEVEATKAKSFGVLQMLSGVSRALQFIASMIRGVWKDVDNALGFISGIFGQIASAAWAAAVLSKLQGNYVVAGMQIATAVQSGVNQTFAQIERHNARAQAEYNQSLLDGDQA